MIRRLIFWILVIAYIVVAITKFRELRAPFHALANAGWQLVAVAVFLQLFFYIGFAASYQSAFHTVDVEVRIRDIIPVLLASLFINVVTPAGGAAGLALIVDDTTRRGYATARVTAGTILQLVADFSALTLILISGMFYLLVEGLLEGYVVLGALILFLLTLGMVVALTLGIWKPSVLRKGLAWLQGVVNRLARRFKRDNFIPENWAEEFSSEYINASSAIAGHPRRLVRTLLNMLVVHGLNMGSLYVLFLAFYGPVHLGVLVAGYSVEFLFWVVSVVPQGTGIVEGSLALVFASLDVPWASAVVVALAFRGLTFWLPLGLGFLVLRRVKSFQGA